MLLLLRKLNLCRKLRNCPRLLWWLLGELSIPSILRIVKLLLLRLQLLLLRVRKVRLLTCNLHLLLLRVLHLLLRGLL